MVVSVVIQDKILWTISNKFLVKKKKKEKWKIDGVLAAWHI